jgi:hypothetical protein
MFRNQVRSIVRTAAIRSGLVALLVGGMLVAQPASPASAAGVIQSTENPVIIPINATSKDVQISWATNNGHKSQVKLSTNNGAFSNWASGKETGSKTLTAENGLTYKFQLFDDSNDALLGSLTVTTKKAKLTLDMACKADCITGLTATPHGTWASFHVTTNEPISKVYVSLSTSNSKNSDGWFSSPTGEQVTVNPDGSPTSFDKDYLFLTPGTTYFYRLEVHDTHGNAHAEEGSLKTLNRKLILQVDTIKVIEDSDGVTSGDLGFTFWMNGLEQFWPTTDPGDNWAGDGAVLHPNLAVQKLDNTGSAVHLKFVAYDDDQFDIGILPKYCVGEQTPPGIPCDFVKAEKSVDFDYVTGDGEAFGKTFTVDAYDPASGLHCIAYGKVQVSYGQ